MIALSVSDISLDFGGDEVLKNITFAINEGERVGVIGSNGAGKTSLLRIIAGELSQSTGEVF
ncbi:MAG: ATP-binding cassette domain-containing protein, partial [Clostridia bacterium]|nr:ATP-binding cassette domain-containing protein [Clostridia bacterium]